MSRDGEIVEFANMHDASCWYVRGHLTADEALQACDEYWMDYEFFDTVDVPETPIGFGPCMHVYGRWGFRHKLDSYLPDGETRYTIDVDEYVEKLRGWLLEKMDPEIRAAAERSLPRWNSR